MLSAIRQFRANMDRVRALGGLYEALGQSTTPIVDVTDLLRAQIVMVVSALDHYIHSITRIGMLEVYDGKRPPTNAFSRFQVTIDVAMTGIAGSSGNAWFEMAIRENAPDAPEVDDKPNAWLETAIRESHGHLAFQHPDKIADAVRLFSSSELWPSVASHLGLTVPDVKNRLRLIVDRRNKIAHEADLDPDYPGSRWPISPSESTDAVDFIQDVCEAIHVVVT